MLCCQRRAASSRSISPGSLSGFRIRRSSPGLATPLSPSRSDVTTIACHRHKRQGKGARDERHVPYELNHLSTNRRKCHSSFPGTDRSSHHGSGPRSEPSCSRPGAGETGREVLSPRVRRWVQPLCRRPSGSGVDRCGTRPRRRNDPAGYAGVARLCGGRLGGSVRLMS